MVGSSGPIATTTTETLAEMLKPLLTKGLPADEETAGNLLRLRNVYARAVVPRERRSRLAALNELLPRVIAGLNDHHYREAVQVLFGLSPGTRGTGLMARRRQAAELLGYNATYFRTDVEARLVQAVAVALHDDLLRYQLRTRRDSSSLEPTGQTPRLGAEHLSAYEELVSRIWQHVYGLRAELIAFGRLNEQEAYAAQAEDHRQAALRQEAALQELIREFRETYGESLIRHGETEYAVEALGRLTGCRYDVTSPGEISPALDFRIVTEL